MNNFEPNLSNAMNMCGGKIGYYSEFSKIYPFTTENISGYINYFDFQNKSLLTVGSSFDQVLNAYMCGARDITLYDINPYAKYYAYLKIASVISLDYQGFENFFFIHANKSFYNTKMFNSELFNKIKPILKCLDYESCYFFDKLFSSYKPGRIRDYLFDDDESREKVIKGFNLYLRNEDSYNKLKNNISEICFKYINGDIFKDDISGKYDNIFLSNLCTTTSVEKLKELVKKLDDNNLNINGSILLGYLWDINFNDKEYIEEWLPIYKLPITKEKLKKYITEHHNITGARDILWKEDKKNDLVLIYRKR